MRNGTNLKILIDADGCPVVDSTVTLAKRYDINCKIICDASRQFNLEGPEEVITVSNGVDSVDFVLVNMLSRGDIVITQDYGLAAMCLARGAVALSQDGILYEENMDAMSMQRHASRKLRASGVRIKGNKKRTPEQNKAFIKKLEEKIRDFESGD